MLSRRNTYSLAVALVSSACLLFYLVAVLHASAPSCDHHHRADDCGLCLLVKAAVITSAPVVFEAVQPVPTELVVVAVPSPCPDPRRDPFSYRGPPSS